MTGARRTPTAARHGRYTRLLDNGDEPAGVVGERGAGLARLNALGLPVPPSFAITSEVFGAWRAGDGHAPRDLWSEVRERMGDIAGRVAGRRAAPGVIVRPSPVGMRGALAAGEASAVPSIRLDEPTHDRIREAVEALWHAHALGAPEGEHAPALAVVVQQDVPLRSGPLSGSGLLVSRDPITGSPGTRVRFRGGDGTPPAEVPGGEAASVLLQMGLPRVHEALEDAAVLLETTMGDMCVIAFRVDQGRLWLVDGFAPRRSGQAAIRVAVDMVDEGYISVPEALRRIPLWALEQAHAPVFAHGEQLDVIARGAPLAPGAAAGRVVFGPPTLDGLDELTILITPAADAHDVALPHGPAAIVLSGPAPSNAPTWAFADRPAVCHVPELVVEGECARGPAGALARPGDPVSVDGRSGIVAAGEVRLVAAQPDSHVARALLWADERRAITLGHEPAPDWPSAATPEAVRAVRGARAILDVSEARGAEARTALLTELVDAAHAVGLTELGLRVPDRLEGWDPQPPAALWGVIVAPTQEWAGRVLAARVVVDRPSAMTASPPPAA